MGQRLEDYVKAALTTGTERSEIITRAKDAGWDDGEVATALATWAAHPDTTGNPIPMKRPSVLSEGFFYLLRFTAFYVCLWGVIDLAFAVINRLVPAIGASPGWYGYQTRSSVAALSVALPLYIWMLVQNGRFLAKDPTRYESNVRKGFIYSVLFASAGTAIVSAIMLVNGLLAREGNANGGTKLGALIVLSAILFFDYGSALKPTAASDKAKGKLLWAALAAVVALYGTGLVFALKFHP